MSGRDAGIRMDKRFKSKSRNVTSCCMRQSSTVCLCGTIIYPSSKHVGGHCFLRPCYVTKPHWHCEHTHTEKKERKTQDVQSTRRNGPELSRVLQIVFHLSVCPSVCGVSVCPPEDVCCLPKLFVCIYLTPADKRTAAPLKAPSLTCIKQPRGQAKAARWKEIRARLSAPSDRSGFVWRGCPRKAASEN